jgi:hypothetical protein
MLPAITSIQLGATGTCGDSELAYLQELYQDQVASLGEEKRLGVSGRKINYILVHFIPR